MIGNTKSNCAPLSSRASKTFVLLSFLFSLLCCTRPVITLISEVLNMERIVGFKSKTHFFADANDIQCYTMLYKKRNERDGKVYMSSYSKTCAGRVVVENNVIKTTAAHSHTYENHREYCITLKFRQICRNQATQNPEMAPMQVYLEAQKQLQEATRFVSYKSVRNLIENTRKEKIPAIPTNLRQLGECFMNPE